MKLKGYMGKILNIDLTRSKVQIEALKEDWLEPFIGGSGLGTKYLFEMTDEKTDPLGPENPLIFMTGPFTGTPVPLSGRHAVVSLSPLTGIFGESDVGGTWGAHLKKAGFDGIIIAGKSPKPAWPQASAKQAQTTSTLCLHLIRVVCRTPPPGSRSLAHWRRWLPIRI